MRKFVANFAKAKAIFSSLAVHGMPACCGRKGSQVSRKRKGSQPVRVRELGSAIYLLASQWLNCKHSHRFADTPMFRVFS